MTSLCSCQDLRDIKETLNRIEQLLSHEGPTYQKERVVPAVADPFNKIGSWTEVHQENSVATRGFSSNFDTVAAALEFRKDIRSENVDVLTNYTDEKEYHAYTLAPGAKGEVTFPIVVPSKSIITDIRLTGDYLTKVTVEATGKQATDDHQRLLTLGNEISVLRKGGSWLHLMDFLSGIPWFGTRYAITITCASSMPVTIRCKVATLPPLAIVRQNIIAPYRGLSKCGEGDVGGPIQLHTTHPTVGLLLVPPFKGYLGRAPVAVSLIVEGSLIINVAPLIRGPCEDVFGEGAFWIKFPRTLDMSTCAATLHIEEAVSPRTEGAEKGTFTISNLYINFLQFAAGTTCVLNA